MGEQVVVLMSGSSTILKVMMCKDMTYDQIVEKVRNQWQSLLTPQVKLVIANVISTDDCIGQFQKNGMLALSYGSFIIKE
jgi:hypothetical protein